MIVRRRQFLALSAGLVVSCARGACLLARPQRVIVAGAGIIGAAIAYQLTRRGADVTVLEKNRPASGATEKSFAWINATFSKQPRHYYELNRLSMIAHHQIEQELAGALPIRWGGALEWYADAAQAEQLRHDVRRHQQWGYLTHLVPAEELTRLERNLVPGPIEAAAWSEQEGTLDPVQAVQAYLEKATALGARVEYPCEVTGLNVGPRGIRQVRTSKGEFEADALVVACGVDTSRVARLAGIDVPLKDSPGVLAHTTTQPQMLGRVALAPGAHMKQELDGRVVTGAGFGGSPTTNTSREYGEQLIQEAATFLPKLKGATLERVTLGWRPLPRDEFPIIGFAEACPNMYIAVMHSGVTLSALIGQLAALEILDGANVDLLESYRLSRFRS
jgi:glycine/D-amino acid oxidase-like deaminating enzyme